MRLKISELTRPIKDDQRTQSGARKPTNHHFEHCHLWLISILWPLSDDCRNSNQGIHPGNQRLHQRSQSVLSAVHQTDELSLCTLPSSTYILVNGFDGEKNWTSASQICASVGDILVINWSRWLAQSSTKALAEVRGTDLGWFCVIRRGTVVLKCAAFPFSCTPSEPPPAVRSSTTNTRRRAPNPRHRRHRK